jgi:formiminoglutamase
MSLGTVINANIETMPKWKGANIAILGVNEYKGCFQSKNAVNEAVHAPNQIRKHLYKLFRSHHNYNIVDIGNLRLGENLEATYHRLSEVCEILLKNNVLPLIIGGSHDLMFAQYRAYEMLEKLIDVVNIDAQLDMEGNSEEAAGSHLHNLLMHQPNYLFSFAQLAYQSYLNDYQYLNILRNLEFDLLSVGEMRSNFQDTEPYIRNADMLSFDIKAVKQQSSVPNSNALPFGLTGEEACQLTWYAGMNEKLSSVGFYGYLPEIDVNQQNGQILATMIWYFIEGFYHRKGDNIFTNSFHTKYIVPLAKTTENLIFYKSNLSEKWWLEVPIAETNPTYKRHKIVPCSYQDYLDALDGNLPDRWIKALARGI